MMVSIDGTEYVPTTGKRVRINDVEYAEVKQPEPAPVFTRIVDGDGDVWRLLPDGRWDCHNKTDSEGTGGWYYATRDKILHDHRIDREY